MIRKGGRVVSTAVGNAWQPSIALLSGIHKVRESLMPKRRTISGVVERCGPYACAGDTFGLSVLLKGHDVPYVVRHDGRADQTTAHCGLTMPGDQVSLELNEKGDCNLSRFRNHTLVERLYHATEE